MTAVALDLDARVRAALLPIEAIRVGYFFGSRAAGRARPDSDLDVAVAFAAGAGDRERERARRVIVAALTDARGALGEGADVVDLDVADSAVAFHALRYGVLLFARVDAERVSLEGRVARRYDDDTPKRALFRRAAVAAGRRAGA